MRQLVAGTPHVFTAAEFLTLDTGSRTELLGGVVYDVSPRHEPHRYAVSMLNRHLTPALLDSEHEVRIQDAVAVSGWRGREAPEIDVAVIARKRYRLGPTAADARAFIEVSDSTYALDRRYKIPLYVNAGVPAWIVNIPLRQVECYASACDLELPHGQVVQEGESFTVLGVDIAVADLLVDDLSTGAVGGPEDR
jgi:hypothetical protein